MITGYIPLAIGQTIHSMVLGSIIAQSLPCNIIKCATDGVVNSNHDIIHLADVIRKFECEGASRNLCIESAKRAGKELFFIQDSDTVHVKEDNLEVAVEILKSDSRIGCVLLSWRDGLQPAGFRNACSVFRLSAVKNLVYDTHYDGVNRCHCQTQKARIDGLTVWSGIEKRIEEIRNNLN